MVRRRYVYLHQVSKRLARRLLGAMLNVICADKRT